MKSATRFPRLGVRGTLRALIGSLVLVLPVAASDLLPIFDAHLHYNDEATAIYPVSEVPKRFRDNGVTAILANSRPNDGTRALLSAARDDPRAAPRVVPRRPVRASVRHSRRRRDVVQRSPRSTR